MSDFSDLSNGALVLRAKDVAERVGKLRSKATLASFIGVPYVIPVDLLIEEQDLFGELFKRLSQT